MKSIAVVSSYTKRVANAVKNGDTKEAVASLAAGQMACKYRDDVTKPANADEMTDEQIKDETKFLYIPPDLSPRLRGYCKPPEVIIKYVLTKL